MQDVTSFDFGTGSGGGRRRGGTEYAGVAHSGQDAGKPHRQLGQGVLGTGLGIDHITVVTSSDQIILRAREFFKTAGVDFTSPTKVLLFNERLSLLMVRATLQELDIIEQAIQILNLSSPTSESRFLE